MVQHLFRIICSFLRQNLKTLQHKIRTFSTYYLNGCRPYFKWDDSNKQHRPGIVIGQDGKIIYICYGSRYTRVSAYHIIKLSEEFVNTNLEAVLLLNLLIPHKNNDPDNGEEKNKNAIV